MRMFAAGLAGAVLLMVMACACGPARADVRMTGTFTATQTCPAYQSFRKSTDPGDVKVEPNKTYAVIAKNKPDATHYRILVEGASRKNGGLARRVGASGGRMGQRADRLNPLPRLPPRLSRATRQACAQRTCSPWVGSRHFATSTATRKNAANSHQPVLPLRT